MTAISITPHHRPRLRMTVRGRRVLAAAAALPADLVHRLSVRCRAASCRPGTKWNTVSRCSTSARAPRTSAC